MTFKAPAPPYVGPAAHTSAGSNQPITRIVIHGTVSPCVKGGARATARYFASPSAGGSAHYVVDPGEVVQDVYDSVIAWHAPPNPGSIGVELCDPETGPASRWHDADHEAMLALAAELVAGLCLAYDVPVRKIGVKSLLAGKHGICGHVDVSNAWHESDHSDPRGFPWKHFMALVEAEVTKQRGAAERKGKRPAKKAAKKKPAAKKAAPKAPVKADAETTTRPERAATNLEHLQGTPERQRLGRRLANRIRRVFHLKEK